MTVEEELQLVEEAKTNIQSFGKIYDFYFTKIYVYCINRLMVRELAEDITSQVFLKAVEHISQFDTSKRIRFSSWLYKTANNSLIDLTRRYKKQELVEMIEDRFFTESNAEKETEQDFRRKNIAITLAKINGRYQEVISLRFFSELEIEEIAETIGEKKSNVSVLLHRALKSFQKQYEEDYPDEEKFSLE